MALSQFLDDSPLRLGPEQAGAHDLSLQAVYNERHRLALEELLSGGLDDFLDFLRKEKTPNFLSDDEVRRIRSAAVPPRCASLHAGEEQAQEPSLSSSLDCSSVTYFPDVSDVEPPLLELGWPAFTAGSYRGVTRAVAHFQPSYGESIYSCKEAARRMIQSAKEVCTEEVFKTHLIITFYIIIPPLILLFPLKKHHPAATGAILSVFISHSDIPKGKFCKISNSLVVVVYCCIPYSPIISHCSITVVLEVFSRPTGDSEDLCGIILKQDYSFD